MFEFSPEQTAQMRSRKIGDGLIETFEGSSMRASKDAQSQDVLATDAYDQSTRFSFDRRGFIGGVTTPLGRRWTLANDAEGRAQSITNPAGHVLGATYNEPGLLDSISSDGRVRFRCQYDESNNITRTEFVDGTSTSIDYLPSGLPSSKTDRRGAKETFHYDAQNRLTSFADGNGNFTKFVYSNWDRPDQAAFVDGTSESYKYSADGQLREIRTGDDSVEVEHDGWGRPAKLTYSDGTVVQYTYDTHGRILTGSAGEHRSVFTWDDFGSLTGEQTDGALVIYHYDAARRLSGIIYPSREKVEFKWDADSRLSEVKDWNGGQHRLRYAPFERGWVLASPNGLETSTVVNSRGMAELISVAAGRSAAVVSLGYEYDAEDRVSAQKDSEFGPRRFHYDAAGQIVAVETPRGLGSESFDYDGAGNLTRMSASRMQVNSLNQLVGAGSAGYEYDARGNTVAIRGIGKSWRFTYDGRNLLIRAESSTGEVATYEYDAFRRRVSKTIGSLTVKYAWAGDQLIGETWNSDQQSGIQDYLYYPGTPTPLAMRTGSEIYCYHNDHLGRPRALSGPDGSIAWSADYSAFGEVRSRVATIRNPLGGPGQYFDEETGLHYNRYRYYSAVVGRYLTRDPASYLQGLNLYQYSSNNPVNQADPLGLWWKTALSIVAAVAAGALVVFLAPLALPAAIIVAGAAAGAVGFGLNEGLNQKEFSFKCILKEAARGALIGAAAAVPFALLPATAGYAAFMAAGGVSGAISYTGDWATSNKPWSWKGFAFSIGLGIATAGAGRFIGGRFAQWKASRVAAETESAGSAAEGAPKTEPTSECECVGEPVDAATGEMISWHTDFVLAGTLPIQFDRSYASSSAQESLLGPHWSCTWGQRVIEKDDGSVDYFAGDGRKLPFTVTGGAWQRGGRARKTQLRKASAGYEVREGPDRLMRFARAQEKTWLLTSMEDANRNAIRFQYDESNTLRSVVHTGGYRLSVSGGAKRIQSIELELPNGRKEMLVGFGYDPAGRLNAVFNGTGVALEYQYDSAARMTKWKDREQTWYEYRYDERGRCAESIGPGGMYHYRFEYDDAARRMTARDSYGAETVFQRNAEGRIIFKKDPSGGVTLTSWDSSGNRLSETDPEQRRTVYRYDEAGNLLSAANGLGETTKIEYDGEGRAIALTDPAGTRWRREYDQRGNLISAGLDGATRWRYERDGQGNLIRIVDPLGKTRSFTNDAAGLPLSASDWVGNVTHYIRDGFGRIVSETDPLGTETRFEYGVLGKLTKLSLVDGRELHWRYDSEGNLTQRRGPDGGIYEYEYGPFDQLTGIRRPSGSKLQVARDLEGRLAAVRNARGEVWKYRFDPAGRVIEEEEFSGRKLRFEYDKSGLCIKRTNGNGESETMVRDGAGRLTRRIGSDGDEKTFRYNANGLVIGAENRSLTVGLERDEYGRVVREVQGQRSIESKYDECGRRKTRKSSAGRDVEWTYDANGQVARIELPGDEWLEFTRDAMGRETERRMRGGVALRQEYDPLSRLTKQWAGLIAGGRAIQAVAERQYRYDVNDSPAEIDDKYWGGSRYSYDADGRILRSVRDGGVSESFSYDADGNITGARSGFARVELRFVGQGGRLEHVGSKRFLYDADGRLIEKHEGDRLWKYKWSVEGRLCSVTTPTGEEWQYEYDAFGRRVKKSGPGGTTTYVWDGAQIAEEVKGRSVSEWLYEPGSFRPLGKLDAKNGRTYMCVTDQVGTPRELLTGSGTVAWSARLRVWGEVEQERAKETECPIRFQGQWFDEESGLTYNWHRYYDADAGEYISPDPTGLEGGTRSFGYVHNPMAWVDPFGLAGCPDTNSAGRSEAFNKAKAANDIPTSQQPDKTFKPGTPDGDEIGLDPSRNGRLYEFTNSQGQKVWIREDYPASYGSPDGAGDQGPHFNAGPAGSQKLPQHHYWTGGG